jgi:quercetin dioxygenase-like cupin family protein
MPTLRLLEDRLASEAGCTFAALNRVLYLLDGDAVVTQAERTTSLKADAAWHGTRGCRVTAGPRGVTLLRFELVGNVDPGLPPSERGVHTAQILAHPVELDPHQLYLMRCDRVDFAPGGEALPHGHKGGGIRRLLAGELEVRVGEHPGRLMKPGDAWFESGREPVHAIASAQEPTAFIRVSILPRAIRGQSSIVYVDPAHAAVKPRKYTVFVDEPIDVL